MEAKRSDQTAACITGGSQKPSSQNPNSKTRYFLKKKKKNPINSPPVPSRPLASQTPKMQPNSTPNGGDDDDGDLLLLGRLALSLGQFPEARSYATLALQSNPITPKNQLIADQILAVATVHVASPDLYAVLGLGNRARNVFSPESLLFSCRTLARLLDPDLNKFANADRALDLVNEAYAVLSDPEKRSGYDAGPGVGAGPSGATFWTVCATCCHVHEYERVYEGKEMRCPKCRSVFLGVELPEEPPAVEGADMYYCSWGCFPVGFPGGYRFQWGPQKKEEEEEKEMEITPPTGNVVRRTRQTARKTVRPINFNKRLRTSEEDDDGDDYDG